MLYTRSSKLKTGDRYEDKFWNPGFYEWGQVVLWIFFIWFLYILFGFLIFIHYNLRKCIEPKKETNGSFDPRYALKFPAQFLLVQDGAPG